PRLPRTGPPPLPPLSPPHPATATASRAGASSESRRGRAMAADHSAAPRRGAPECWSRLTDTRVSSAAARVHSPLVDWSVKEPRMDFRLNDEQIEFRDHCHRFAAEVIRPAAARYDREQEVPWDVIREARKWDLHG